MKPVHCLVIAIAALFDARPAAGVEIVVRLVDVTSGSGEKNCEVGLYLGKLACLSQFGSSVAGKSFRISRGG